MLVKVGQERRRLPLTSRENRVQRRPCTGHHASASPTGTTRHDGGGQAPDCCKSSACPRRRSCVRYSPAFSTPSDVKAARRTHRAVAGVIPSKRRCPCAARRTTGPNWWNGQVTCTHARLDARAAHKRTQAGTDLALLTPATPHQSAAVRPIFPGRRATRGLQGHTPPRPPSWPHLRCSVRTRHPSSQWRVLGPLPLPTVTGSASEGNRSKNVYARRYNSAYLRRPASCTLHSSSFRTNLPTTSLTRAPPTHCNRSATQACERAAVSTALGAARSFRASRWPPSPSQARAC